MMILACNIDGRDCRLCERIIKEYDLRRENYEDRG